MKPKKQKLDLENFRILIKAPDNSGKRSYVLSKDKRHKYNFVFLRIFDGEREGEGLGFPPDELYELFNKFYEENF